MKWPQYQVVRFYRSLSKIRPPPKIRLTLPYKTRQKRELCQTHAAPPTSAPWRAAHVGERRAVAGAGAIGEQVAIERATCRGYYSCCTVWLLYCSLFHYKSVMSGFLSTWVGLLSNGVGLFKGEGVLESTPTPLFEQPLKFIPMGVFSRAYGIMYLMLA